MNNRDAVHRILQLIKAAIKKNVTISNNMMNQKKKLEEILKGFWFPLPFYAFSSKTQKKSTQPPPNRPNAYELRIPLHLNVNAHVLHECDMYRLAHAFDRYLTVLTKLYVEGSKFEWLKMWS